MLQSRIYVYCWPFCTGSSKMVSRNEFWFCQEVVLCCSLWPVTRLLDSVSFLEYLTHSRATSQVWRQSPDFHAVYLLYEVWSKCQYLSTCPHFFLSVLFPFSCHSVFIMYWNVVVNIKLSCFNLHISHLCSAGCMLISFGHTKKYWLPLVGRHIDLVVSFS